ncbi:hypothetical protein BJ875DRAFT_493115 [Amylocarpus encephaloides]|uniref:Uncharacterized protein n=1 Tax=Amylocarpus encephaloides TaxID=45428 RepID=A0A9P7YRC2_9HELO|nr:hypothetical protein BJ875DRAFT_493115 [Amylocarpus encephaloides]
MYALIPTLLTALALLSSSVAYTPAPCPTITSSLPSPYCPRPTPLCPVPDCIYLSILPLPCYCTAISTQTAYTACPTYCAGNCATQYSGTAACTPYTYPTQTPPTTTWVTSSTTTPTSKTSTRKQSTTSYKPPTTIHTITQPSTCVTVTKTDGSNCPTLSCVPTFQPSCHGVVTSTLVNPCGCTGIAETTKCKLTCDGSCKTSYETLYLPCPTKPPMQSTAGDFTTTRSLPPMTVPI